VVAGFLAGAWTYEAFYDSSRDMTNLGGFKTYDIILGSLAAAVMVIEGFGQFAIIRQQAPLVRTYAFLSILASLIAMAFELFRIIIHFTHENGLIAACVRGSTNAGVRLTDFWGIKVDRTSDSNTANDWCRRSYNHESWSLIVGLLIIMVATGFLTTMAFNYHHQLVAVGTRILPQNEYRMNPYPTAPDAPYNSGPDNFRSSYSNPYDQGNKPPTYDRSGYTERDLGDRKQKEQSEFDEDDEDLRAHGPKVNP
jgi:hypothetical protein